MSSAPADPPRGTIEGLRTPALVCVRSVVQRNCTRMLDRAAELGCRLRPHVKTHKTLEGGSLQTGGTRRAITVSTLAEAEFFAAGGFDDILYAVPITADKLPDAARLTRRLGTFHVMVDHPRQLDAILAAGPPAPGAPWSVVVMVDFSGVGSPSLFSQETCINSIVDAVAIIVFIHGSIHATVSVVIIA